MGQRNPSETVDRRPAVERRRGRAARALLCAVVLLAIILSLVAATAATATAAAPRSGELHMPWRQAGWTEREAAAHLLDRFAFGARPGDVDRVVAMGLDAWLEHQLAADLPERDLARRLAPLDALRMDTAELLATFPGRAGILRRAQQDGVVPASMGGGDPRAALADMSALEQVRLRRALREYAREQGFRPPSELYEQLTAGKLLAAVYAENQLREVLTDFWFNHFNVSVGDPEARLAVPTFERDAVRPHVLGDFRTQLGATARHPAMLLYLDNARSVAAEGATTLLDVRRAEMRRGGRLGRTRSRSGPRRQDGPRAASGLNENYARELLELHTLGVDGGYAQDDVVEVARAFSGWTVLPPGPVGERVEAMFARAGARRLQAAGVVRQDLFLFRPDAHDAGAKSVLGHRLGAGGGIEDGEAVLDLLAAHPSTARHLAEKLARRFVSDDPPAELVDRLAATYTSSGGDLAAVVRAVAGSPQFWSAEARRAKIKSPLAVVASSLRAVDAEVVRSRRAVEWIAAMGEPLYRCDPPTGYADRAEAWVGTGSLLSRMNFGLALAAGGVEGVRVDLPALLAGREPPSASEALERYFEALLPERDPGPTLAALTPLLGEPELARRLAAAAPPVPSTAPFDEPAADDEGAPAATVADSAAASAAPVDAGVVARAVGLLLGSPEFQRH